MHHYVPRLEADVCTILELGIGIDCARMVRKSPVTEP